MLSLLQAVVLAAGAVHSKMMVTDDEFAIVGSANINTRSMAGTRDTEIAVGTYQPKYMATVGETPKGQVSASLEMHGMGMVIYVRNPQ
jgi:phosphatidylserine/phosphatidylglycerophosphate/cardiolipin synthase-like enzyme